MTTSVVIVGQVGPQVLTDGVGSAAMRQGKTGEMVVQQCHGRFFEQNYRGNMFSIGATITALSANTISLTATTTPIVGIWNPNTSPVNAVILQAAITVVSNNLTSGAGPGLFVWASSVGNTAITAGSTPLNRKSLTSSGSYCKGFPFVALTGLTNNLVIFEEADFGSPSGLTYGTIGSTALMPAYQGVENFDGSLIVPPGGVLALLNTTSCTVFSASSRLLWEEVAL